MDEEQDLEKIAIEKLLFIEDDYKDSQTMHYVANETVQKLRNQSKGKNIVMLYEKGRDLVLLVIPKDKKMLEEVKYTIALSLRDNIDVKEVIFNVDNEEIMVVSLETIDNN